MPTRPLALALTALIALTALTVAPAHAAQPLAPVLAEQGTLAPAATLTLPVMVGIPANLRAEAHGNGARLTLQLRTADGAVQATSVVADGEIAWSALRLPAGGTIVLQNSGTAPLDYSLEAFTADLPTARWQGRSLGSSTPSTIAVGVATPGIYDVILEFAEGGGTLLVNEAATLADDSLLGAAPQAISTTLRVPLRAGAQLLTLRHDAGQAATSWQLSIRLRRAVPPPTISALSTAVVVPGQGATIIVSGTGYDSVTQAEAVAADGSVALLPTAVLDATELRVTIPVALASGSYRLLVRNELGSSSGSGLALLVGQRLLYLSLLSR